MDYRQALLDLIACVQGLSFDGRLDGYDALESRRFAALRFLEVLSWKTGLPTDFPLIATIVGGTGTGKSTVFNSLAGEPVSPVGAKRPCTREAVVFVAERWAESFTHSMRFTGLPDGAARVVPHRRPERDHLVLIDTPDYDSIETANRVAAETFFVVSDCLIFVTSQEKYADREGSQVYRWALEWPKHTVFLMNKVSSDAAFEDFKRTLEAWSAEAKLVRIEKNAPAPPVIQHICEIPLLGSLLRGERDFSPLTGLKAEESKRLSHAAATAVGHLEELLTDQLCRVNSVVSHATGLERSLAEEMDGNLAAVVTPDIEQRMRERLELLLRKYDILYVPRSMVRNAVRSMVTAVWDFFFPGTAQEDRESRDKELRSEDLKETRSQALLDPLETAVSRFDLLMATYLSADARFDDLRDVVGTGVVRWDAGHLRHLYDETFPGVEHVLEKELDSLREGLSGSDELKLYGSYFLWALVLITAEIAVGGGFTILDALLNTVIGPLIPKWLVDVKIVDLLRDVGRRVEMKHRAHLHAILTRRADLYRDAIGRVLPSDDALTRLRETRERCFGSEEHTTGALPRHP